MNTIHILLVEDNEGDVLLTRVALDESNVNFKLSVVNDGKEALDFLNKEGKYVTAEMPHLVLLDINLPKKNGHEVLQYIKEQESLKHIPIIMLTTSSSKNDIDMAYAHQASGFITKPSEVNEFISEVTAAVNYWMPKVA